MALLAEPIGLTIEKRYNAALECYDVDASVRLVLFSQRSNSKWSSNSAGFVLRGIAF